jgi:hypothetical protein
MMAAMLAKSPPVNVAFYVAIFSSHLFDLFGAGDSDNILTLYTHSGNGKLRRGLSFFFGQDSNPFYQHEVIVEVFG